MFSLGILGWKGKKKEGEEADFPTSCFASACRGAFGDPTEGMLCYLKDSCLVTLSLTLFMYCGHVSAAHVAAASLG